MSSSGAMRFTPSRAAQAESYLAAAADALRSAGDPTYLWKEERGLLAGGFLAHSQQALDAVNRRLRTLRSSVIFSALAVEAYANDYLADVLDGPDAEALDRLSPLEKLIMGSRAAGKPCPISRGSEPAQSIVRLFAVRNRLVHPRRDRHGGFVQHLTPADEDAFGPPAAGKFLQRAAELISAMEATLPGQSMAGSAAYLTRDPTAIRTVVDLVGETIDAHVPEQAAIPPDPIALAEDRALKRGR